MTTPDLINKVIFFSLLDDKERTALTTLFKEIKIHAGQVLFYFGDPGDTFYLVKTGSIELSTRDHGGSKIMLAKCGPGNFFGELSLFDGGARTATAAALEDSQLLVLNRENLNLFLEQNPSAALDMLKVMGQRIRNTGDLLRRRVTRNVNDEIKEKPNLSEKIADNIARICGSLPFLLGHMLLYTFWIIWNIETFRHSGINWMGNAVFDPFPYGLLAMSGSIEAIILSTCVLISQNRQAGKDRIRSDIEYEVNLKAELEVAHLHEKIDHMHAEILSRLHKLK